MTNLPTHYAWLAKESGPKMLLEALKLFGTIELPGNADSPQILAWAKELGLSRAYSHDSIPWCGLFAAIVAHRAGWEVPKDPLWALNWANFGTEVPLKEAMLGDVLVFKRDGGGHVAQYVGEDKESCFHIIGGNQSDKVCIIRKRMKECVAVRRAPWKIAQPSNVRKVILSPQGALGASVT